MRGSKQGNHWISEKTFESRRVYFNFDTSELILDAILESDQGKYQCRVDYKHLPTSYNTWLLNIIGKCLNYCHLPTSYNMWLLNVIGKCLNYCPSTHIVLLCS